MCASRADDQRTSPQSQNITHSFPFHAQITYIHTSASFHSYSVFYTRSDPTLGLDTLKNPCRTWITREILANSATFSSTRYVTHVCIGVCDRWKNMSIEPNRSFNFYAVQRIRAWRRNLSSVDLLVFSYYAIRRIPSQDQSEQVPVSLYTWAVKIYRRNIGYEINQHTISLVTILVEGIYNFPRYEIYIFDESKNHLELNSVKQKNGFNVNYTEGIRFLTYFCYCSVWTWIFYASLAHRMICIISIPIVYIHSTNSILKIHREFGGKIIISRRCKGTTIFCYEFINRE